jgi:hypothetical protein
MIRITNRDLDRGDFIAALKKLNDSEGLSGQQAYWIMRLTKACDKQVQKLREDFTKIAEKYAVKKDDGKIATTEDGSPHPSTGFPFDVIDKQAFTDALNEMYTDGIDVKFMKFSIDDLCSLGFKPRELNAISMLMLDSEALEEAGE